MGGDKFSAALDLLKGFNVNLYVGEEVFNGKLIGVEADHVVLETDNKYIFYYNIDQIQAITKNTKQFQPEKAKTNFQTTQSLLELLHSFQHSWVRILSVNKQKFSGVLSEIDADFATLINGEERILIKLSHVSNILKGVIKEEEKKSEVSKEHTKKENEAKGKGTFSTHKTEDKIENKVKSSIKEAFNASENKTKTASQIEKTEYQQEMEVQAKVKEHNDHMEWSQPLITETAVTQPTIEAITNNIESKKQKTDVTLPKATDEKKKNSNDMKISNNKTKKSSKEKKKSNHERKHREEKNEEPKINKTIEKTKETKPVNEVARPIKMETAPPSIIPTTNKEVKAVSEESSLNNQSLSKQKEHESRGFRFAGEPVSRESDPTFPFAGWPNRTKKTFRS
ncbi:hypothetical protein [Neobacillus sp.]|uniref:hypothetical protein n=1 Tax=Neobacillus sp. TaxID=2675273 RepID=UPI00289ABA4B|nr:hypothetical protein [Neobacillus sp.]